MKKPFYIAKIDENLSDKQKEHAEKMGDFYATEKVSEINEWIEETYYWMSKSGTDIEGIEYYLVRSI